MLRLYVGTSGGTLRQVMPPLYLPYTSPIPLHLLYLPYISPIAVARCARWVTLPCATPLYPVYLPYISLPLPCQVGDFTMRYAPFPNLSATPYLSSRSAETTSGKGKGRGKGKG